MNYKLLIPILFILSSCKTENRPISYGKDACAYCKMMVMDQRYGTELVTQKGKIFVFDAAECMIDYLNSESVDINTFEFILITPYNKPETLFDANNSFFLRSKELPSPMGAYLTAFTDEKTAMEFQKEKGGKIYSWTDLVNNFNDIRKEKLIEHE